MINVGLGIVVDRSGSLARVLVSRRRPEAHLGGLWEFPGGKVQPGERSQDTVVRELAEELGITVEARESLDPVDHAYDDRTVRLYPWLCVLRAGRPQNRQVDAHRWVGVDELAGLEMPAANRPIVQALGRRL